MCGVGAVGARPLPFRWVVYVFEAVGDEIDLQNELPSLWFFCDP